MNDAVLLLGDAHVHIYDCYTLETLFDAAHRNFRAQAECSGNAERFVGVLFLSESGGCDWFHRLAERATRSTPDRTAAGWWFEATEESDSLIARASDGRELMLVAGHQIVTAERLEVLALCSRSRPCEDLPLHESLEQTKELGGIAVIPWGAGKWLGERGSLLSRLLQREWPTGVFLGDNGGRLGLWPRPRHFVVAERLGVPILPGTDPLPFASHQTRPGSFGFSTSAPLSNTHPSRDLRQLFADPDFVPRPYGRLSGPLDFVRNQAAMQVRIRTRGR